MDEAEIGAIQLVKAREDAAKVLELVDTTFDEMALAVEPAIILALHRGGGMGRDHRLTPPRLDGSDEGRACIPAIGDHAFKREPVKERFGLGAVVALARRQDGAQRIA